jgi:hypothetical protein
MALQPFGPWPIFQFFNRYTIGTTPWTGDQHVARPLPTHRTTQIQNKRTQTSMPRVGFEPTIPVFEWAMTVLALVRAATVIISRARYWIQFWIHWIHSVSLNICYNFSHTILISMPTILYHSSIPAKILHAFFNFFTRTTCLSRPILLIW